MTCPEQSCAIFGGTFDPVHNGHLRSAVEVREALGVAKVRLIPACRPPHRDQPATAPADRLEMLKLATRGIDYIEIDDREIKREGKSYTIDTLESIRDEAGTEVSMSLVLGSDAWAILDTWRDWQRLTDLVHVVILRRAGQEPDEPEVVRTWSRAKLAENPAALQAHAHGLICRIEVTRLDISATRIRELFSTGRSPDYLMPGEVIEYIRGKGLYNYRRPETLC
ncbi:MAG: nicotinate-nucleotide adenylyltransferase [Pseudomonadales bacterium]